MQRLATMWLSACLLTLICALPVSARSLERASIVLQWLPQAQFAGYYIAKDKGYYEQHGIDLTIIPGGPDVLASEYLETERADFATMFLSTGLQRRDSQPIVNIGQFVQHSALMLLTKKSANIQSVEDLAGKKIGLWANEFQIQARALFKRLNIRPTVVPQTSSLDLFLRNGVQAASGMWYNEYHTLLTYGMEEDELRPFFFKDLDLDFPEDGIYALEKTANGRPELCRKIVRATAQGWKHAFEHPEEALDSIMKRMKEHGTPANRAHQRWMLARMQDIIDTETVPNIGVLNKADFDRVSQILLETGFIESIPLFPEFYRGPVR